MAAIDTNAITMLMAIQSKNIPSHICIAYAVAMDNGLMNDISKEKDMSAWLTLASDINDLMQQMDEPRFTLYDYLDACVNGPLAWDALAEDIRHAVESGSCITQNSIFTRITDLAENKRQTYSGEF